MTRHVVMFSGGITSWAVAERVVAEHGADHTVLLFADTLIEDEDLYRFNTDVAQRLGVPITRVADGRTPFEVFRDRRFLGNTRRAPCSVHLKQEPCRAWVRDNISPDAGVLYVGIDWTETHRLDGIRAGWAPWRVEAPLCEPPYLDKTDLIEQARNSGLQPPRLYGDGFAHNNCGGVCVRAGQGQWAHLLATKPDRYAWAEGQEEGVRQHLGQDVAILRDRRGGTVKPLTLRRFRERIADADLTDIGGCGCFTA